MSTAPTLKRTSAKITYTASDGYRAEIGYSSTVCPDKPHEALLGAFEELSRILHLFGFGKEALQRAEKIGDQTIIDMIAGGYLDATAKTTPKEPQTMAAELTDEQIARVADRLWEMGEISSMNTVTAVTFARAILALATQPPTQGAEPVAWQYRHIATQLPGDWRELVPTHSGQTQKQRVEEVLAYRYEGSEPCYEVRELYTAPPPTAEVEKKAARYDWLRSGIRYRQGRPVNSERVLQKDQLKVFMEMRYWCTPDELDALIDAAIQSEAQAGKGDGHD